MRLVLPIACLVLLAFGCAGREIVPARVSGLELVRGAEGVRILAPGCAQELALPGRWVPVPRTGRARDLERAGLLLGVRGVSDGASGGVPGSVGLPVLAVNLIEDPAVVGRIRRLAGDPRLLVDALLGTREETGVTRVERVEKEGDRTAALYRRGPGGGELVLHLFALGEGCLLELIYLDDGKRPSPHGADVLALLREPCSRKSSESGGN